MQNIDLWVEVQVLCNPSSVAKGSLLKAGKKQQLWSGISEHLLYAIRSAIVYQISTFIRLTLLQKAL